MEMSFSVSGMGTSGVCSECFSFALPLSEHPNYFTEFPGGTPVQLGGTAPSPVFYISSKDADDISVKFTCYDRMTFTEADFPCDESDFIDEHDNEIPMQTATVLSRICSECGFAHYFLNDSALITAVPDIPKSLLLGRTCRDVLTSLSEAFCGYWCCSGLLSPDLYFVPFGTDMTAVVQSYAEAEYHEALRFNSQLTISGIYLTDNTAEFGAEGDSDTLRVNTPLADPALYSALYARARSLYSGVSCGNAYLDVLPSTPFCVTFAGEENPQYINYCTAKISSHGILASLGRNIVDEGTWIYKNRTRREIEKRYAEGDVWKNTEVTKKGGLKMVYVNENTGAKKKYGFDTHEGGLTAYDGGLLSKQGITDVECTYDPHDSSKLTELAYTYCGETVRAVVTWLGDNISSVQIEEDEDE